MTRVRTLSPFIALFALTSLSGCSSTKQDQQKNSLQYLLAKPSDRIPAQEFEKALRREVYLAGGNYHIVAFPYTPAYLKSLVRELAREKSLSPKDESETLKRLTKRFISNKTCFKFRYSVLRFNEVGQLKDWQVTYFNEKGAQENLTWESNPKRDPSFAGSSKVLDELHAKWLGDSVACINKLLPLTQSFGLKVKPQYVQFPFDSHGDLYWDLESAPQKLRHQETNL